jgi:hypothetical protein
MFLVAGDLLLAQGGQGRRFRYRGGRGAGNAFSQDHNVFHLLLQHHEQIKRSVKQLEDGVDTLTESDDPQIAAKIQEHVAAMYKRVEEGTPIRMRDPLFAAVFQNADKIKMEFENTKHGVRVVETSDDPYVARLIQAHAEVVNRFVKRGHLEARLNHSVPARDGEAATPHAAAGHGRGRWGRGGAGCPAERKGKCPHGRACPHAADGRKACDEQGQRPTDRDQQDKDT